MERNLCAGCLVTKSCPTLATPWTVARRALLFMRFPRQEYWSGLPFPSPGDLPNPGIESGSPALQAESLLLELSGNCVKNLKAHFKDKTKEKLAIARSGIILSHSIVVTVAVVIVVPLLSCRHKNGTFHCVS